MRYVRECKEFELPCKTTFIIQPFTVLFFVSGSVIPFTVSFATSALLNFSVSLFVVTTLLRQLDFLILTSPMRNTLVVGCPFYTQLFIPLKAREKEMKMSRQTILFRQNLARFISPPFVCVHCCHIWPSASAIDIEIFNKI